MSRKLVRDISASSTQVILNQVLGLIIFFIVSRYLEKDRYGELNWSLAVLTFITTILSLRLEQIVVKKIAAGGDSAKMLTLFTGHVIFTGLGFYLVLGTASLLFPAFFQEHDLLLILAISHLLAFFSSPFKQLANGLESFRVLAGMSSVANVLRAAWLAIAVWLDSFTIEVVLGIYIFSSLAELAACYLLARYSLNIRFSKYRRGAYTSLIRESLPMAGAVILHATIARIDWILIGLFTTAQQTAEYSFAYRIYELSPVPLLIIAPVLLSRFSRFFSTKGRNELLNHGKEVSMLIRVSMIIATAIPLALNLVWAPVMDYLTNGKYGSVNSITFLLLSLCTPFLYMNNMFWTVELAQNRLRRILQVTLVTFTIILVGDLALIPRYAAIGAAAVYLCAIVVEYANYLRASVLSSFRESYTAPLICIAAAGSSGYIAVLVTNHILLRIAIAFIIFCLLLLATKQLQKSDWKKLTGLRQRHGQSLHEQISDQPT